MSQDSVDDWRIFDETDDFHHTLTFAADERIHFENLFDQPGPVFPALLAKLPVFAIRPAIVWLESTSGHTLSTALADVRITPVESHKLLSFVRDVRDQRGQPIERRENDCAPVFLFGFTSDRLFGSVIGDSLLGEGSVQDIARESLSRSRIFGRDWFTLIDGQGDRFL